MRSLYHYHTDTKRTLQVRLVNIINHEYFSLIHGFDSHIIRATLLTPVQLQHTGAKPSFKLLSFKLFRSEKTNRDGLISALFQC